MAFFLFLNISNSHAKNKSHKYQFDIKKFVKSLKSKSKKNKFASRFPTSKQPSKEDLSKKLKDLYKEFDSIKDRNQLYTILKKYDDNFDANWEKFSDPKFLDFHFVVANASLLLPFEGILYRTRPIYEGVNWHKNKTEHNSTTLTLTLRAIKKYAESININLPTDEWKAGFDFLAAPPLNSLKDNNENLIVFNKISGFQAFSWGEILPKVEIALERFNKILDRLAQSSSKNFVFDAKFLYTTNNEFRDSVDQYFTIDVPSMLISIAQMHSTLHGIRVFISYNVNRLPEITGDMGFVYGVGGFKLFNSGTKYAAGGSAKNRFKDILELQKPFNATIDGLNGTYYSKKFPKFLRLNKKGKTRMKEALEHLESSILAYRDAWVLLKQFSDKSEYTLYNYNKSIPWKREMEFRLKNVIAMVFGMNSFDSELNYGDSYSAGNQPTAISNSFTNEVVLVKFRDLYLNPPVDLKAFMPTSFRDNKSQWLDAKDASGKKVKSVRVKVFDKKNSDGSPHYESQLMPARYRDFTWGEATNWDLSKWDDYFTNVKKIGVKNTVKTLDQSYGGHALGFMIYSALIR